LSISLSIYIPSYAVLFHRKYSSLHTINYTTMKALTIKSYDFPYIMEAQKILAANPARQLTITALALEIGINSFKLRVGFRQLFKTTIHQYRLDLRLHLATQLLSETDLTISEIAYKTGFESRDGFARCFRRKFQESPRDWRKIASTS
jgi:AraC family transcriptional activator of pyochelin receptor